MVSKMSKIVKFLILLIFLNYTNNIYADTTPWQESYRLEALYQYDAALNSLKGITSSNELVLLRRGWLNYLKGSHSKSIDNYKKALSKNSKSLDARLGIILPLLAQQRWREASLNANKALKVAPWNYYAHIRLMAAEQALKQWKQLLEHAKFAHQHFPSDSTFIVYLARANLKLGNKNKAQAWYKKLLELAPDNFEAKQYLN